MKLIATKSATRELWGLWLDVPKNGQYGEDVCIIPGGGIHGTEDHTPKYIAEHIQKCVNVFDGIVDIDSTIKEFMEWRAEKALLDKK